MDWTQALTVIGVFIGGFIYLISKMDANQKENNAKSDQLGNRIGKVENRLTALESESKNASQRITDLKTDINQRLSNIENCVMPRKIFHFEETHKDEEESKEN